MEDRSLLSVFSVTNLSDGAVAHSGDLAGSFRQAIFDANHNPGDDDIVLDSSLANQTITLTQGALSITDTTGTTTITGLGATHSTVSGNNASCVFYVGAGATAEIVGLTITKGRASSGGGIFNNGALTILDCTISGNAATSQYGGGIYDNGPLTIAGCTISGNSASQSGGGINVCTTGTLAITNSTISGNSATSYYGGGICNGGSMTVAGCTISGNSAGDSGGGIFAYSSGTLAIADSTISGNSAAWGGGVLSDGTLTVSACTISNNSATQAGGGVYADKDGTATMTDSTVSSNTASDGGGIRNEGILTIIDSTIAKNSVTSSSGGGICNTGNLTMTGSTISENSALANGGGGLFNKEGTVTIANSTIAKNSARGGGGLFNRDGALTIADSTIAGNSVTSDGGGVCNYKVSGTTAAGTVTLVNTIVADNTNTGSTSFDVNGAFTANYCLIEKTTGATFSSSSGNNTTGVDPLLGALGDYGGPTQTIPLLPGSAAINAGSNALIPGDVDSDQRGYARIVAGRVDIGAYEYNVPVATLTADAETSDSKPTVTVSVTDEEDNLPAGTTVYLDVDINHDGDFNDAGEKGYATGVLDSGGEAAITIASGLSDGTYGLRARVSDAATHEGTSDVKTMVVDSSAPTVTIGAPSAPATAGGPVTYTVTYSDAHFDGSTLTESDIALIATGTADGIVSVSGSGNAYVVTISDITGDGTLAISLAADTASDLLGNFASTATSAAFVVDNTAPTVAINQAASQADPTDASAVNFTVVFSEAVVDFDGGDVTLAESTTAGSLTAKVTGSGTTYNVAVSGMTGNGEITARIGEGAVHDAAGNGNATSTSNDATVSYIGGPIISNVTTAATTSANKTTITFNATATSGITSMKLAIDGKSVSVGKKSGSKYSATYSYSGVLSAGAHHFVITAASAKGTTQTAGTVAVAATVPTISKVKTKATTSDKATTISWSVADIDGVGAVTLSIDGVVVASGIKQSGKNTSRSYAYSGSLAAGPHTYTITAVDSAGVAATPCAGTLTVKATVPTIKNVKATAKTSADAVTIAWTVYDIDGIGSTTLKIDGATVTAGITQSGSGATIAYTFTGSCTAGKHTFTIDATDAAVPPASAKQAKGTFTVKATAPTISNVVVTSATAADPTTIQWSVFDIDGIGSVKLTIDGKAAACVESSGSYTYTGTLAAGKHTYAITVTDTQKVSSKATNKFTVAAASSTGAVSAIDVVIQSVTTEADLLIDGTIA